jgi:hypothetical protein
MMDDKARRLLYRSFDTPLGDADRAYLDKALKGSDELRREKDAIAALRRGASDSAAESFGPFFAERVMAGVSALQQARPQSLFADLLVAFRPVAVAAGIALAALAPFGIGTVLESLRPADESLADMARTAYTLDLEEMLCQTEPSRD